MNIKMELQKIFQKIFDDDSIEIIDEMTAADIDDWDSLTHIQLVAAIEANFSIKFTTVEISGTKNVGEFIALIEKKRGSSL
jgi:acyl carrier protein